MSQENRKKIGLIWANLNSSNLGVSALAYSALIILEEIAKRRSLKFCYYLWGTQNKEYTVNLSSKSIMVKELIPYYGGDKIQILKNLIRRPWVFLKYNSIIKLKKCDLLADTGEGDSYSDIYGIERFSVLNYVKKVLYSSDRPYIMLPQTIGPFDSKEAREKAQISLEKTSAVIARDQQSYNYCKSMAPLSTLLKSIDMAFFLPYDASTKNLISGKKKIGINVSGLLWEGGYTQDNQFGLKTDYRKLIISILDFLKSQKQIEVHLIGHVLGNDYDIDDDLHVLKEISNLYPEFILAPKFSTPIEAKTYISTMDFFTGARMHACIAAISSGVPVLPMAYSRKFNGLFIETLGYDHLIDLKTMDDKIAYKKFIETYVFCDSLKNEINEIKENIIEVEKERMINLIADYIK